jgi:hypothetical protein
MICKLTVDSFDVKYESVCPRGVLLTEEQTIMIQATYKGIEIEMEMHPPAREHWKCAYTLIVICNKLLVNSTPRRT